MFFKKKKAKNSLIIDANDTSKTEYSEPEKDTNSEEQEMLNIIQEKFSVEKEDEPFNGEIVIYPALLPTNQTYLIQKDTIDIRITKRADIKEYKYGDLINYTIMVVNCSKEIEHKKVGVNEPCPCGSGKKYKKCCKLKEKVELKVFFETLSEYEVFEDLKGKTYSEACIDNIGVGDTINLIYKVKM